MLPIEDFNGVRHYISLDHVISITENGENWTINMAYGQRYIVGNEACKEVVAAIGMADPYYMDGEYDGTEDDI